MRVPDRAFASFMGSPEFVGISCVVTGLYHSGTGGTLHSVSLPTSLLLCGLQCHPRPFLALPSAVLSMKPRLLLMGSRYPRQDMPDVSEIVSILGSSYITYYHCKRIVELLKVSEADTKSFFGSYSSKRMKVAFFLWPNLKFPSRGSPAASLPASQSSRTTALYA